MAHRGDCCDLPVGLQRGVGLQEGLNPPRQRTFVARRRVNSLQPAAAFRINAESFLQGSLDVFQPPHLATCNFGPPFAHLHATELQRLLAR